MTKYVDDIGLEHFFDNIKDLTRGPSYQQVASYLNAHPESLNDPVADYLDENPTATIPDESIVTAKLADSSVTTAKIADGAVTTAKIANGTITANKLANDAIPTMSTTTAGIAKVGAGLAMNNGAVELDADTTGISGAVEAWLDAHPEATTTVEDGAITTAKIANGAVTDAKLAQEGGILTNALKKISITQSAATNIYSGLVANLDANSFVWTNVSWFTDLPSRESGDTYCWVFTYAGGSGSALGTQMVLYPESNETFTRRIKSGSYTDWCAIRVPNSVTSQLATVTSQLAVSMKAVNVPSSAASGTYEGVLTNLAPNTCSYVAKSWFSDAPADAPSYFWVFTTNNATDSARGQFIIAPTTCGMWSRKKGNNGWSEWASEYENASNPVYYAMGDSVTWGAVWTHDGSYYTQAPTIDQMPTRIAYAIGSSNFTNGGVSGARFVRQGTETSKTIGERLRETDLTGVDVFTLGGGRNDSATQLGTAETSVANDGTICGAVMDVLNYLTTTYPKMQIIMYGVTPQTSSNSDIFTHTHGGGWSLSDYYTEVAKICKSFGVPFIDWYECTCIRHWADFSGGITEPGGNPNWSHPDNPEMYMQMGNYLAGRVSSYYKG